MQRFIISAWIIFSLLCLTPTSCSNPARMQPPDKQPIKPSRQGSASPSLIGFIETACAEDIAVYGACIYVADGPGGIAVINASNPSMLSIEKTIPTTYAYRVYLHEDHLYLCDGPGGIRVYSLAKPFIPTLTSSGQTTWASAMDFANEHLYLADYYAGIKIYSLSNPAVPELVADREVARGRDIVIDGQAMVVSDNVFGLVTFTMTSPTEFGWTYSKGDEYCNFEDIIVHKGYCIIARNDEVTNLSVFDISDLLDVQLVDELHPVRFIDGLTSRGDLLVAACGEEGVLGFDMTDPTSLRLLWVIHTPGYAKRAEVVGKNLYVADMSGICIYDISGLAGSQQ
jgi:hypothetical protein